MTTAPVDSALAVRTRYRHSESSAARWRLLTDAADALARDGARAGALSTVLSKVLAFLSLEDGVMLVLGDDALQVAASQGQVPPVGARIAHAMALHTVLQPGPVAPLVRQDVPSTLRIGREQRAGLEVLVPLCVDGRHRGMLALLSSAAAPPPHPDDLLTLQALATLLAAALANHQAAPRVGATEAAAVLKALTPRELQILALLPQGWTNAAMGAHLGIAAGTVKVHVERILHKLDLNDRTQAAVRAADLGLGS
ncbi:LuxR family transcriptional regulator [Duganella sp. Leaf126]|uniref:helix-turn-helix transcriptional regulator n=1 Tax=Duganella sp. Leaf126 TaxID=1736266 RepID=UPI0007018E68|nr:LuxR C-terminal-related transcriptional regulator [Duganella sp. Leaf126]KQQ40295.1 LuxR family transcriptional regulator [Duganella sp. Leaf126]